MRAAGLRRTATTVVPPRCRARAGPSPHEQAPKPQAPGIANHPRKIRKWRGSQKMKLAHATASVGAAVVALKPKRIRGLEIDRPIESGSPPDRVGLVWAKHSAAPAQRG